MSDTGTPGVETAQPTIAPEEIDEIFNHADLHAAVAQLASSVDKQRKQLILMWVAVLGLAGAVTFLTVQGLRDA
jgi:hypoxanthine-guanine phosphoribosyltransferase